MSREKQKKKTGARKKKKRKPIQFQIGWGGLAAIAASTLCVLMWVFVLGFWVGQKIVGSELKTSPDISILERTSQPAVINPAAIPTASRKSRAALAILEDKEPLPEETIPDRSKTASRSETIVPEIKETSRTTNAGRDVSGSDMPDIQRHKIKETFAPDNAPASAPETHTVNKPVEKSKPAVEKSVVQQPKQSSSTGKKLKKDIPESAGGYITLQVASFQERGKAMKEAAKWKDKGYDATYKRVDLGSKGIWFRVYVGRYTTFEKARTAAKKMATKEHVQPYVKSVK